MNSLKKRLKTRELTVGSWITIGDTAIAEIMAKAGFDWLAIDMEHSAIELQQAQQLIQVIDLAGCIPLVRVGENSQILIKRVMDAGAHGVIVPMVNRPEDAVSAVDAVRYPPQGKRGVGLGRAQGYGLNFEGYKRWIYKNSVVIVQIEHIAAVDNLKDILAVEGVDGFIIGPYDLSASIGKPGQFDHPKVKAALRQVEAESKQAKKVVGIHVIQPDPQEVNKRIRQGYNFIAFSLDTLFLGSSCIRGLCSIRRPK